MVIISIVVLLRVMGRTPMYSDIEQVSKIIDEYFDACDNRIQQVYDKKSGEVIEVIHPEPYTMSGLAYALGMDRDTLLEYGKTDKFSGTIKRARDRVHNDVERRLMDGAGVGAIFNLKNNFGWKDKTEVEATVEATVTHGVDPALAASFTEYLTNNTVSDITQDN